MEEIDLLTIMTVDVGYAGQPFIKGMLAKISEAKRLKIDHGYKYAIQIDGSCNPLTYKALYDAGAEVFVMGSSGLFRKEMNLSDSCQRMREEFTKATGVQC